MQLAMREWHGWRNWSLPLKAAAFGIVLGIMGPFGTGSAYQPAVRYPFWLAIAILGFVSAWIGWRVLDHERLAARRWARMAAVAAASAVPMTFVVAWAMGALQPDRSFGPLRMLALFPFVALVQVMIALVVAHDERAPARRDADPSLPAPAYPPDFLSRLPAALREGIVALEAEDHYLRVHARQGSALILMRLADAAAAIDPRLGTRVHRSWWVARDAVAAIEKDGGRAVVRLHDGTLVPISRSQLAAAREALLDR